MATNLEDAVEVEPHNEARHPSPRHGVRKLIWLIVLLLMAAGVYWLVGKWQVQHAAAERSGRPAGPPTVPVATATATKGELPVFLNGLGSVDAFNTVTVKSRVDGQLVSIAFREGQYVEKGAPLAEIDPRPFQVQVAQAEAQLAKDQATLANAKVDLARYRLLAKQGVIPSQQLDTQSAVVNSSEAVIQADRAQIDSARLQLSYCHIAAPISGRIGLRLVDIGNMVHAADPNGLVVITQIQPIAVLFTIPEDNLREVLKRLRSGERLPVEAYDRSGQTKIADGRLLTLDNQIDQATGTTRLKAVFDNKDNLLYPNQFVNVRLLVETRKDVILVPAVAIQRGPQGTFVYVVKEDQTADVRPVNVGPISGDRAEIGSGLSEGEQVVVDGVDKLREGSKVQVSSGSRPRP
jgi:multidrug efflux system membrane fusion protein